MSLSRPPQLAAVAKKVSRELRRNSTRAEKKFWEAVRGRRFFGLKFLRQHPLFVDPDGRETFFVADFYCAQCRFVVELDGEIHDYRINSDAARTSALRAIGVSVVRFRNEEIELDLCGVLNELDEFILSRPREVNSISFQ